MSIVTGRLPHKVTWWKVTGPNGFGGDAVATPVLLQGRWEDRQETFVGNIDRRELISKAVVYLDQSVAVGDYLAEGDLTGQSDPTSAAGALKVQRFDKVPDLRNLDALLRAVL